MTRLGARRAGRGSAGVEDGAGAGSLRVGESRFGLGTRIERLESQTGADQLTVRADYAPQRRFPPVHLHPAQTEMFTVRSGQLTVWWPDGERVYGAGESFTVRPGTPHAMRNAGPERAVVDWTVSPARRTPELFARMFGARPRPAVVDVLIFVWTVVLSGRFRSEMRLVLGARPR